MIDAVYIRKGIVCAHHSGRVYTVTEITNTSKAPNSPPKFINGVEAFPVTVVFMGANGNVWSRPLTEFMNKFTILHDGKSLVSG